MKNETITLLSDVPNVPLGHQQQEIWKFWYQLGSEKQCNRILKVTAQQTMI